MLVVGRQASTEITLKARRWRTWCIYSYLTASFPRETLLLFTGRDIVHKDSNVTFLHDVCLALLSVLACFFHLGHTGLSTVKRFEVIKITD